MEDGRDLSKKIRVVKTKQKIENKRKNDGGKECSRRMRYMR